jgi:hypothetical protein
MNQVSESKFIENVRNVVVAVLTECRKVVDNYINVYTQLGTEPLITLQECEVVKVNLINYISLLNKILNAKPLEGSNQERSKWMASLEPHIFNIGSDKMCTLGDLKSPVIINRQPPNSKAIYEVHLTKIYCMANDIVICSHASTTISGMRQMLLSSLINLCFLFFDEHRTLLTGVRERYNPNNGGMKFLDDIMGEIPNFLKSQIPDSPVDTELVTNTIRGLIPKPGETPEEVQDRLRSTMRNGNLSSLVEQISRR